MISIVVPIYKKMPNWEFLAKRCLDSVKSQTFKDYELITPQTGLSWSENHNAGIREAKGEYIKFLGMDDYFFDDNSLQKISEFKGDWLVSGCVHTTDGVMFSGVHFPKYNDEIVYGKNTIGGPSCLTVKNKDPLLFDENLTWLVDCDYYKRLYDRYGEPSILGQINVIIGLHPGQTTNLLSDETKINEHRLMREKYQ